MDVYTKNTIHGHHSDDVVDFRQWVDSNPITLHYKTSVEIILELFQKLGLRFVLLVDKGRLKGIITKKDLLRHLQQ